MTRRIRSRPRFEVASLGRLQNNSVSACIVWRDATVVVVLAELEEER